MSLAGLERRVPGPVAWWLVYLIVAGAGCRTRAGAGDPPRDVVGGIGFELPGDPHVTRGALISQPPGREESFLAFVAGHAPVWADACYSETGSAMPLFGFETDARGALSAPALAPAASARERCLSAQVVATTTAPLRPETRVTVQLAIKPNH